MIRQGPTRVGFRVEGRFERIYAPSIAEEAITQSTAASKQGTSPLSARYRALLEVSLRYHIAPDTGGTVFGSGPSPSSHRRFQLPERCCSDDSARNVMRVHILESDGPDSVRLGMEFSIAESPSGWVWANQQPLVVDDLDRDVRFTRPIKLLCENMGSDRLWCSVP